MGKLANPTAIRVHPRQDTCPKVAQPRAGPPSRKDSVLVGVVADRIGRKATAVASTFVMAGTLVWLIWSRELWMFYVFALVYGFAFGGRAAAMAALIGDTFGLRNIGAILGILEIGWAIGAALGPALGGLIFDMTDSYLMAFVAAAVAAFAATLLIVPIRRETDRPRLLLAK